MGKTVLITGANGFVGRSVCTAMLHQGWSVKAAWRGHGSLSIGVLPVKVGNIDGETDWSTALDDVEVVIHLAARVHVMKEMSVNPLTEFTTVNLYGTENLARQAARAGVKRFIYVSSIGVNGNSTSAEAAYSENDAPCPHSPYALSKWQAEQALAEIAEKSRLEVVIVRPPLVYGENAPGNFAQMMQVVARGIPLPLGSLHNQRDLLYVGNLTDALILCALHPAAAGQTYLLRDGETISTTELLRRLAQVLGAPSRLFSFPEVLLRLAGRLAGKPAQVESLIGSLRVEDAKIRRELNWIPPYTLQQGLQLTAEWYQRAKQ